MSVSPSELNLRHVDPARLLFESRHPARANAGEIPEWYQRAEQGGLRLYPWWRGTVLAELETKVSKDAYFAVVSVMGLYMTDEQNATQDQEFNREVDSSTLEEATAEEQLEFTRKVLNDLYPFLRAELHTLTGRLQGIYGVMLQPYPEIRIAQDDGITTV